MVGQTKIARRRAGFTLPEAMAVAAIIIIVLSMLMSNFSNSRETARTAVCASNLHQWSTGLLSHRADNRQQIMATTRMVSFARYPSYANMGVTSIGEFDTHSLAAYVPGASLDDATKYEGVWRCPSSPDNAADFYSSNGGAAGEAFLGFDYSYLARVGDWTNLATKPDMLLDRTLSGNRIWMSDRIFRSGILGTWSYNHSLNGPSWAWPQHGNAVSQTGPPRFSGTNQMYGDGHVQWKHAQEFDPTAMDSLSPSEGFVKGAVNDATFY